MKMEIIAKEAPITDGPYSQAIKIENLIFLSGQGPIDPKTNEISGNTFVDQLELTLKNIKAILESAGASEKDIVKVNAYLSDIGNFGEFNKIYRNFFSDPKPARTTVECQLSGGILVEIDVIAYLE